MMLADIVVNASTDPEAFGRTIVEAQAMGRIVIAADHGGARETILANETGFLFPPGDATALAAAIDAALDMPTEDPHRLGPERARPCAGKSLDRRHAANGAERVCGTAPVSVPRTFWSSSMARSAISSSAFPPWPPSAPRTRMPTSPSSPPRPTPSCSPPAPGSTVSKSTAAPAAVESPRPPASAPAVARLRHGLRPANLRPQLELLHPGRQPAWSGIAKGCALPHADPNRNHIHTRERLAGQLHDAGIFEPASRPISPG